MKAKANFDIPKNCGACPFMHPGWTNVWYCGYNGEKVDPKSKPVWCPHIVGTGE